MHSMLVEPTATPSASPPLTHSMDPRRGSALSPMFAAVLCWLLGLDPLTRPAITGLSINGNSVLASTRRHPFFDIHLGHLDHFERNLRDWGQACEADDTTIASLVATLRSFAL